MDTEVIPQQPVSLWRNRDYLLLWLGHAVSSLGTSCTQFAFPLLIVGLTRSIAAAGLAYDFVSRFFSPSTGIAEDPVTGSAHCCLGPFWSGRLGKNELVGYQASRRGGTVRVRVDEERVYRGGQSVTLIRGELRV